jgi:hypothetical protein
MPRLILQECLPVILARVELQREKRLGQKNYFAPHIQESSERYLMWRGNPRRKTLRREGDPASLIARFIPFVGLF